MILLSPIQVELLLTYAYLLILDIVFSSELNFLGGSNHDSFGKS
jgi:hypothetical protein